MGPAAAASPQSARLGDRTYSVTRRRTIDAAMELFADHGVSGTSYQMVADALGVTKAAVYHQFKTKDALVQAVAEVGLAPLDQALEAALEESDRTQAREALLTSVVDLAVARRRWAAALQGDPVMIRLLGSHEPFVDLMNRVYALLLDVDADSSSSHIRTAIVSAALGGALASPVLDDVDEETVRAELTTVARQLVNLSG